ncbi:ribosomal protein S18-alanine N-acetyltransferase [Desulfoferrobacter suflitae]|uniref:ribosomal protein S18-alanine N-acetyltransferase n=1 Tax=Desulfoferrobacter suflitae TaxID=2865782 RepID=UPI00216484A7|nr:ribosomal protein S18-alanine N-acetyltransferase [Desulfoferrobacter suflitae]MCK8600162.1 ribosomal protein S18-alanine N-acetyltransferase [Desulfoferrobacter suflitae]
MTASDIPLVLTIERDSQPDPWSEGLFLEELTRPHAHVLVARALQRKMPLMGYICFWDVAQEIQILNVSVHRSCRRRGIGRCLVAEALLYGSLRGATVAVLEVRQGNLGAQRFYTTLGFRAVGSRPDYYGPGESAILMERDL